MRHSRKYSAIYVLHAFVAVGVVAAAVLIPNLRPFHDATGAVATFNSAGDIDTKGTFFTSLGTNGRSCGTCHLANQGFGLSSAGAREVFQRAGEGDPLFAAFDGANCPTVTGSRAAHSLLLDRGLIRVGITMPAHPEFTLNVVHDPYGCALTSDPKTGLPVVSVYRRPLPATNLRYLTTVMFDGRETLAPLNNGQTFHDNLILDLTDQALSATMTHAQAAVEPTPEQLSEIVQFEMGLTTAQIRDERAGHLFVDGAKGGPTALSTQKFYPGVNDVLGADPTGAQFNSNGFTLYSAWGKGSARWDADFEKSEARSAIAAGEKLFNTTPLAITGVRGLNDNAALGSPAVIMGTCTTCHDSPNIGNHSLPLPLDIGTSRLASDETNPSIVAGLNELSAPDLPVYRIGNCPDPQNSGQTLVFYTSDPGKALITGLCSDVNRGKGPVLRGLAARAPYFHNGAAANLDELVSFYNQRFQMNLTAKEKAELVAFLNAL